MDVLKLCSPDTIDTTPETTAGSEIEINAVKRLSNAHSSPILPPILPSERPNYYGGRPDPPTSTISIPRRQLWTLPSRTPSYDSLNNDIHEHESAKHPEIEKVISQCHILCEDMDRYKTLINSNNNRLEQYELFDAMAKNAHHLLHTLQGMRSARPRFEKLEDPDRGTKRSLEKDYEHNTHRNDRIILNGKPSSLPAKQYRRRAKRATGSPKCHSCNTTDTPEWRRGPDGARTLCNACGLHYAKLMRKSEKKPA